MVRENLAQVRKHMEEACRRAGRQTDEVTLIAVSKTKPVGMLMEAYEAGARDFGENKVQEILEKRPEIPADARFHMIGHLQRNKVRQVIDQVTLIHSVDSLRLAEQIEHEAAKKELHADILLEVNVAREESKFGFFLEEVEDALREISKYPHITVKGLMTIAPYVEDPCGADAGGDERVVAVVHHVLGNNICPVHANRRSDGGALLIILFVAPLKRAVCQT